MAVNDQPPKRPPCATRTPSTGSDSKAWTAIVWRAVLDVRRGLLGEPAGAGAEAQGGAPVVQVAPAGDLRVLPLGDAVVEREHLVPRGLGVEDALELGEQLRPLGRPGRGPGSSRRSCRRAPTRRPRTARSPASHHQPRRAVPGHRRPALVVDPAVADHLEVLRRATVGCGRVVEGVPHRRTLHRLLRHAVHRLRHAAARRRRGWSGSTSMTWWNWCRTSPCASMPAGQCTTSPSRVPPKCEATCLVHWYGVFIASAQPTG